MKNRKGFTLIEMLAVVTIIGLLAGLIINRINRSIADSKKTASLANANLLVGAFEDYYMQAKARGAFNGCSYDFGEDSNTCTGFSFTGAQPDEGIIALGADGKVNGDLAFGDYSYVVDDGIVSQYVELDDPVVDFDYVSVGNDKEQYFIVPITGYYKLEVWGAQGGSYDMTYHGGYGGYSSGVVRLVGGSFIFINVGGAPTNSIAINESKEGGYNGGGRSEKRDDAVFNAGGGATHIALTRGTLSSFDTDSDGIADDDEIRGILIVAGGGGGAAYYSSSRYGIGGSGGGMTGVSGNYNDSGSSSNCEGYGFGGTQTSGGDYNIKSGRHSSVQNVNIPVAGFGFGSGGDQAIGGTGGGGGFYGGRGTSCIGGSGGGSGYIGNTRLSNGVMYCYGCTENSVSGTRTIDSNGSNKDVNCPNGYSTTAISNCAKSGDGHARVTYIGRTLD